MKILNAVLLILSATFLLNSFVDAAELKSIVLKDGSILKGEILQFDGSAYTVKTQNLGEMKIFDSDILSISSSTIQTQQSTSGQAANLNSQSPIFKDVQKLQGSLLADPVLMQDIQNLIQNDEIMTIMSDQNFLNEVMSLDPAKLQGNPNMQKLLDNPEMKKIIEKFEKQMEKK